MTYKLYCAQAAKIINFFICHLLKVIFGRYRVHHLHKPGKRIGERAIKVKNDEFVLHFVERYFLPYGKYWVRSGEGVTHRVAHLLALCNSRTKPLKRMRFGGFGWDAFGKRWLAFVYCGWALRHG